VNRRRDSVRIEPRPWTVFGRRRASMRDIMQLRLRRCFPVGEVLRNIFDVWCQVATASVFGRLPMQSPHPIALRKEAAGVAREAQAEWVRNGAPARGVLFELHGRCRASAREHGCSRASGKDLEGERSPGRIGRPPAGNGRMASRTRRRSKASKPTLSSSGSPRSTLATEPIGRGERDGRERQGGNGHGDVVRLRSSGILRGV